VAPIELPTKCATSSAIVSTNRMRWTPSGRACVEIVNFCGLAKASQSGASTRKCWRAADHIFPAQFGTSRQLAAVNKTTAVPRPLRDNGPDTVDLDEAAAMHPLHRRHAMLGETACRS